MKLQVQVRAVKVIAQARHDRVCCEAGSKQHVSGIMETSKDVHAVCMSSSIDDAYEFEFELHPALVAAPVTQQAPSPCSLHFLRRDEGNSLCNAIPPIEDPAL